MKLGKQKKLAARVLGVSKERIKFDIQNDDHKKSLKELISRDDVRSLTEEKVIIKKPKKGTSRTRANHILVQKGKGRRAGQGSRKGTAKARFDTKRRWIIKIRGLRATLSKLKAQGMLSTKVHKELYLKSKGNFFRNKRHLSLYMEQNNLLIKNGKKQK